MTRDLGGAGSLCCLLDQREASFSPFPKLRLLYFCCVKMALFSFQFSNLLGTVYRCGNLNFTCDGNSVISPVGNRVTVFDLKK